MDCCKIATCVADDGFQTSGKSLLGNGRNRQIWLAFSATSMLCHPVSIENDNSRETLDDLVHNGAVA